MEIYFIQDKVNFIYSKTSVLYVLVLFTEIHLLVRYISVTHACIYSSFDQICVWNKSRQSAQSAK